MTDETTPTSSEQSDDVEAHLARVKAPARPAEVEAHAMRGKSPSQLPEVEAHVK